MFLRLIRLQLSSVFPYFLRIILFVLCLSCSPTSWADDAVFPPLSLSDRILILAPHPDDETIGTAGIIQESVHQHLPIRVVYLTNGDDNEVSFMVYKKRPVLTRQGLLKMGRTRQQEAREAMNFLGLTDDQLIFLGYPDGGTLSIFIKHWKDAASLESRLTRSRAIPYTDAPSYQLPHKGESILNDLKKVLQDFQPTKIFVTMPADHNSDHQAAYLFLSVALLDLEKEIRSPEVFSFLVHAPRWPSPIGFHADQPLTPPEPFKNSLIRWMTYPMELDSVERKRSAVGYYRSQIEYRPKYLYSFVRSNELFGDYPDILLKPARAPVDWDVYQWIQHIVSPVPGGTQKKILQSVIYAVENDRLKVRVKVDPWTNAFAKTDVYLMPYRYGQDFGSMPKIKIRIDLNRFVTVYDQSQKIVLKDFSYEYSRKEAAFIFQLPLDVLQNPDHVLTSARAKVVGWPMEFTAWRMLKIEKKALNP